MKQNKSTLAVFGDKPVDSGFMPNLVAVRFECLCVVFDTVETQ